MDEALQSIQIIMKYIIRKVVNCPSVEVMMKAESGDNIEEISITPYDANFTDSKSLTSRQKQILDILHLRKDNFPSLHELTRLIGVSSINTVVNHLKGLQTKGYIEKVKHSKKEYKLLK